MQLPLQKPPLGGFFNGYRIGGVSAGMHDFSRNKKPLVAAALPQNTDFILPDVPVRT
ncbi:hypothetical protein KVR801_200208 [Klebsiella variicola]|nr:hypothetical protein KVR801_200208 [Klebsiella variicola]